MTGYQRFAAYVYEYRKGKKGQNCGFIKVEVKEGRCLLEIRLRCQGILPDTRCKVYGFVRRDGLLMGVLLGSLQSGEDRLEGSIETEASNMGGSGIPMSKMGGMILLTDTGAFYGTEWDDQPIRPANFQEMKPKEEPAARRRREGEEEPAEGKRAAAPEEEARKERTEEETPEEETAEEETTEEVPEEETEEETEEGETPEEETAEEESPEEETPEESPKEEIPEEEALEEEIPEEEVPEEEAPEEEVPAEEALEDETSEETSREKVLVQETADEISGEERPEEGIFVQEVAEMPVEERPVGETTEEMPKEERAGEEKVREERDLRPPVGTPCVPFPDCDFSWCGRLQLRELLQSFPRQRGLINNRFLQYGCHHFGHILLCRRQDGQYLLGVPGVYEQQEGFMARTFGFPYFKESPLVQTPRGRGGYWYRLLDAPDLHQGNRP